MLYHVVHWVSYVGNVVVNVVVVLNALAHLFATLTTETVDYNNRHLAANDHHK